MASFWSSIPGKAIRWALFLPVGLFLAGLLEFLAFLGIALTTQVEMKNTLLNSFLSALLWWPLAFILVPLFFIAIMFVPKISCWIICPSPRIGSYIFATVYAIYQAILLPGQLSHSPLWMGILKILLTAAIVFVTLMGAKSKSAE
jgi:hypothetical protein